MSNTIEQLEYLIEMARTIRPTVTKSVDGNPLVLHESIWTEGEMKAIKKKMIDCINKLEADDNKPDNL
jgi:hypothetical protein